MRIFWTIWILSVISATWISLKSGMGIKGFLIGCIFGPMGVVIVGSYQSDNRIYGIYDPISIISGCIILLILSFNAPIIGIPLAIFSIYKYRKEKEIFKSPPKAKITYLKPPIMGQRYFETRDAHLRWAKNYEKRKKSGEKPRKRNKYRTFLCPSCNQKIRVKLPLPKGIGKCKKCHIRFRLSIDESGNLLVFSIKDTSKDTRKENNEQELTIDNCFLTLGIDKTATPEIIKTAYKKQMQKNHPDKVASLGPEIRHLAEKQTKQINRVYKYLKKYGYLDRKV